MARHPNALTVEEADAIAASDEDVVSIVLSPSMLPQFRAMFDRVGVGLVPLPFATEHPEFILSPDSLGPVSS